MSSDDRRASGPQTLRDFSVRAAETRRFGAAGEGATASAVLCQLDTVDSALADDDAAEGAEQTILVTPEAAENLAGCLHKVATRDVPDRPAASADK